MKGKTSTGFEFEVNDEQLDDWTLLKYLRKVDQGEVQYMIDAVPLLLGEEQEQHLEKHLYDLEGSVKATSMAREVSEIMQSNKDLKN